MKVSPEVNQIISNQLNAVLSTSSDNQSYSCLVSFVITEGFNDIVFATKRKRLKYRKMAANPHVSLLIDNRENKMTDLHQTTSITIVGSVEDVTTKDSVRLSRLLLEKHPNLRDFVESPDTAIMRLFPEQVFIVDDFESVKVWEF